MNAGLTHRRLVAQHLAGPPLASPAEVVESLVGVQSQDYVGAKWALGLRTRDATDAAVDRAFDAGEILRTHALRPTWHFVTPADIRWLLMLNAPRVRRVYETQFRAMGMREADFERSNEVVADSLRGGNHLTRDEVRGALESAGIETRIPYKLQWLLARAELDAVACSGALREGKHTYALLSERAPHARVLERDEALAELAHRYFFSRGPATVQDMSRWSGQTVTDCRRGLDAVRTDLAAESIGGREHFFAPDAPDVPPLPSATAFLLPNFDELVSGYGDRSALGVPKDYAEDLKFPHYLAIDGRFTGLWRRDGKDEITVTVKPFRGLEEAERRAIGESAERYAAFLGQPVTVATAGGAGG